MNKLEITPKNNLTKDGLGLHSDLTEMESLLDGFNGRALCVCV